MVEFVDQSARPGPSTWQGGDYAKGRDDYLSMLAEVSAPVQEWHREDSSARAGILAPSTVC
jgi:hypothetical protein